MKIIQVCLFHYSKIGGVEMHMNKAMNKIVKGKRK